MRLTDSFMFFALSRNTLAIDESSKVSRKRFRQNDLVWRSSSTSSQRRELNGKSGKSVAGGKSLKAESETTNGGSGHDERVEVFWILPKPEFNQPHSVDDVKTTPPVVYSGNSPDYKATFGGKSSKEKQNANVDKEEGKIDDAEEYIYAVKEVEEGSNDLGMASMSNYLSYSSSTTNEKFFSSSTPSKKPTATPAIHTSAIDLGNSLSLPLQADEYSSLSMSLSMTTTPLSEHAVAELPLQQYEFDFSDFEMSLSFSMAMQKTDMDESSSIVLEQYDFEFNEFDASLSFSMGMENQVMDESSSIVLEQYDFDFDEFDASLSFSMGMENQVMDEPISVLESPLTPLYDVSDFVSYEFSSEEGKSMYSISMSMQQEGVGITSLSMPQYSSGLASISMSMDQNLEQEGSMYYPISTSMSMEQDISERISLSMSQSFNGIESISMPMKQSFEKEGSTIYSISMSMGQDIDEDMNLSMPQSFSEAASVSMSMKQGDLEEILSRSPTYTPGRQPSGAPE